MAGMQVGCISVDDKINVQAFVDMVKSDPKLVVEKESTGDDGRKYIPIHKKD